MLLLSLHHLVSKVNHFHLMQKQYCKTTLPALKLNFNILSLIVNSSFEFILKFKQSDENLHVDLLI